MKKNIFFLILSFLCITSFAKQKANSINTKNELDIIVDFIQNPFAEKSNYPDYFSSSEAFYSYFSNCSLKTEDLENKLSDEIVLQRISISFENVILYYFRTFGKTQDKVFLERMEISPEKKINIKHNILLGMSNKNLTKIFGNNYRINKFETNYEICYEGDGVRANANVNFLFDYKNKLTYIVIHGYTG